MRDILPGGHRPVTSNSPTPENEQWLNWAELTSRTIRKRYWMPLRTRGLPGFKKKRELSQQTNSIEGTKLKIPEIGAKLLMFPIILKFNQDQILHYLSNTSLQIHFKSFKLPRRWSSETTLLVCETQLSPESWYYCSVHFLLLEVFLRLVPSSQQFGIW